MTRTVLSWLVIALAFSVAHARADVAPPDDYKERCTLERTCPKGSECVLCPADFSAPRGCSKKLAEQGFAMKCKSWGASVWNEIWCREVSDEEDASTAAVVSVDGSTEPLNIERCTGSASDADSDCSCRAPGAHSGSEHTHTLLGWAAAAFALLLTRARRLR